MQNYLIYAVWAFIAGALIPVMAVLNGQLSRSIDSSPFASVILIFVGLLASVAFLLLSRTPLPNISTLMAAPAHLYTGGFIVAFYIISVTILAPKFGVGNTILFIVSAQICVSAAIDAWGLFGAPVRPVNLMRIIGLVILFVGLVIAQLGSITSKPNS